jgi:hypothetical protein
VFLEILEEGRDFKSKTITIPVKAWHALRNNLVALEMNTDWRIHDNGGGKYRTTIVDLRAVELWQWRKPRPTVFLTGMRLFQRTGLDRPGNPTAEIRPSLKTS